MSKNKIFIVIIIVISIIVAGLWIGGIIPKQIAQIYGNSYMNNHFPEMQLKYVSIEWSKNHDDYIISFKDKDNNIHSCTIGPKYFPINLGQGLFEIEEAYREEFEGKKDNLPTNTEYEFIAEIIEAKENYIIVKPDADSRELKSSDKILIGITRPTNGTNDFYVVGNKVRITCDGTIMASYPAQVKATKVELVTSETKNYTEKIAYANYSSDNTIISECLNKDKMLISSVRHLPVYKFETKNELDEFKNKFENFYNMNNSYNEIPSFNNITANYDDEFFKNNTIILAYISTNSGSLRYGISEVKKENKTLCLNIVKTNNPEVGTSDMSGWFVMAELDKNYIKDCIEFDAKLER